MQRGCGLTLIMLMMAALSRNLTSQRNAALSFREALVAVGDYVAGVTDGLTKEIKERTGNALNVSGQGELDRIIAQKIKTNAFGGGVIVFGRETGELLEKVDNYFDILGVKRGIKSSVTRLAARVVDGQLCIIAGFANGQVRFIWRTAQGKWDNKTYNWKLKGEVTAV